MALLAATKIAGLTVEDHHCVQARGPRAARCRELLSPFPVDVREDADGSFILSNGPVELYCEILRATGEWTEADIRVARAPCKCKTKHGLIPSYAHKEWATCLSCTPLAAAVSHGTRSLGAHLTSCTAPADGDCTPPNNGEHLLHTPAALRMCSTGTFKKARGVIRDRVNEMLRGGFSLATRSGLWNVYNMSTLPYPATFIACTPELVQSLRSCLWDLFPSSWIRRDMISDLGPAMDLKGFPKDPGLVIQVSSILALGRGGLAGPTVAQQGALRDLADTIAWAEEHHQLPHEQKQQPCYSRTVAPRRGIAEGRA